MTEEKTKRTITLQSGKIVDCGVKEFDSLKQAMDEQDPKKIAFASFKVLLSSNIMMKELAKQTKHNILELRNKRT